jgi:hypothetical protein
MLWRGTESSNFAKPNVSVPHNSLLLNYGGYPLGGRDAGGCARSGAGGAGGGGQAPAGQPGHRTRQAFRRQQSGISVTGKFVRIALCRPYR